MSNWYDPFKKGARQGAFVFTHFLMALLFVSTGFVLEHVLRILGDPKLFDLVPWRYICDVMDVSVVGTFIVMGVLEAIKVFRD